MLCDFVEISLFFLVLDRSVPLLFRCFLLGFLALLDCPWMLAAFLILFRILTSF